MTQKDPGKGVARTVLRLLVVALALYLVYLGIIFGMQRRVLYPGVGHAFDDAPAAPAGVERWTHPIEGGEVHAYFAPATQASSPAVVLFHGNTECAEHRFAVMGVYRRKGFNVLVPEYRGYRGAAGTPTQHDLTSDMTAFVSRLREHPRVDPARVVFHGFSLGGAVAAATADVSAPNALVLQSTFTSVGDMAADFYAPGFLARDPFDTAQFLAQTKVPTMVVHGASDPLIPLRHAQANAAIAAVEPLILPGGHNVPIDADSALSYWRALFDFYLAQGIVTPASKVGPPGAP